MPANVTNVLVRYYLYESQSSSISRGIARFSKNSVQEIKTETQIANKVGGSDGYAKSNGTNYLVELDALKKYDIIILKCEFEIIRMYKLNKLIYGYPLKLNKIISYQWNISNKHLDKFKLTENPYTRLYSQEFNVWNLVLVPCATTYNSKGNISLRLRLYELPPAIKSIKVVVVLSCKQFDKSWTTITDLSYGTPWTAWPPNTLKKSIVDERLFDEKTNNAIGSLNCLSYECKIEIISITLYKLNNVHNLEILESDSKYKNLWNKFVMDDNNIFMRKKKQIENIINSTDEKTEENDIDDEYDLTENYIDEQLEDDDEYLICKKEDYIRQNILKSLNLTENVQKNYLMSKVHMMQENIRVLRKEKEQNTKMLKQLQSMMISMQKNMKSMERQIESVTKKKLKDDDNENFIKRLKKEKAKRDKKKDKDGDDGDTKVKKKKKKRKTSKDSKDINDKKDTDEKDVDKTTEKEIIITPRKRKGLTAKQQLFKTWMDMVVNLPQYFELFVDSGYEDLTYIENMQLSEQDLIQIGIQKKGHRKKILQEIKKMKPKKDININSDTLNTNNNNAITSSNDDGFTNINNTDVT
eukprot:470436_1